MEITFQADMTDVVTFLSGQTPGRVMNAIARSINRSLGSARTVMVRAIAEESGLKAGDVRDKLPIRQASALRLEGELSASPKAIPLIQFHARGPIPSRGKPGGVTAKVFGATQQYPNAFIATMNNGHTGVFVRTSPKRLPIKEKLGPSLPSVFIKYQNQGVARAVEALETNLEHELERVAGGVDIGAFEIGATDE